MSNPGYPERRCGRVDVHNDHVWKGPRYPGEYELDREVWWCSGEVKIEGGYVAVGGHGR